MSLQIDTNYSKASTSGQAKSVKSGTVPVEIKLVKNTPVVGDTFNINKIVVPKEINKQLEIVFKNSLLEMEDMAKWLKAIGGDKVKNDVRKMFSDQKFCQELINIFNNARKVEGNQNKNVADLVKDHAVLEQVFECFKENAPKKSLLSTILSMSIIKSQFGKMVDKNKHYVLLYGEPKQ